MKQLLAVLALTLVAGCNHVPPNVAPSDRPVYIAREAIVVIGTLQHAAIELNRVQICDPVVPPAPASCHMALSDSDTGIIVDAATDAITTIKRTPLGWFAVADTALQRISNRLGQAGQTKMKTYIEAARAALAQLGGGQ